MSGKIEDSESVKRVHAKLDQLGDAPDLPDEPGAMFVVGLLAQSHETMSAADFQKFVNHALADKSPRFIASVRKYVPAPVQKFIPMSVVK